jgi:predicted alpha/beta superfamily hydrolase
MSRLAGVACAVFLLALSGNDLAAQSRVAPSHLLSIGVADSLYSTVLKEQRSFWIHLPNGGNLFEGERYPVIYLLDGGVHLGGLAAVQEYYNQFRMPEMIVVGISNASNRTRDLTPTEVDSRHGAMVEESGGSDRFTSFLAEELIPLIDSKYPTTSHRVLIGHSYAGLFAVNTLVNSPDLFTNYIALDPTLGWDDQRWLAGALSSLESLDLSGKGLFVSVANEIIRFSDSMTVETVRADTSVFSVGIRSSLAFVESLEVNGPTGLRFGWKFSEKDIHGSIPLVGMRDAMVYLYDFWELKSPSRYNDPDTPTEQLLSMIRSQSEARAANMGYPLPMEEGLLDMLAFMSLDAGQPDKARAVLGLSAEYYPQSQAVHSSLVDVCLATADFSCAEVHALLADGLAGGNENAERVQAARNSR